MSSARVVTAATIVLGGVLALTASIPQTPPASASQTPPRAGEPPQAGAPEVPARGRAAAAAAAGRARRSTPNTAWLSRHRPRWWPNRSCSMKSGCGMTDERMVASIQNGVPNTEMEGFKQALTELQIWQLVQYIRTQGGNLAPRSRSSSPTRTGHVIKTETLSSQGRGRRAGPRDALGARVPSRWPHAYHRACRPPPHPRQGEAVGAGERHADRARTAGRRDVRRRDPSAVREERLDLSRLLGSTARFRPAAPPRRAAARGSRRRVVAAGRRFPR